MRSVTSRNLSSSSRRLGLRVASVTAHHVPEEIGVRRWSCCVLSLASLSGLGAAGSDVADAVMKGDAAAVRRLLQQKADVNAAQVDGATALHWAVYRDDLEARRPPDERRREREGRQSRRRHAVGMAVAVRATPRSLNGCSRPEPTRRSAAPNGETTVMFAARNGNPRRRSSCSSQPAPTSMQRSPLRGDDRVDVGGDEGHRRGRQGARRAGRGCRREVRPRGPAEKLHGARQ